MLVRRALRAAVLAAVATAGGAALAGDAAAPVVQTSCGAVSGAVDALPLGLGVALRYDGVPFAAPPVGGLRFRPPAPPACPWAGGGVLNGSVTREECLQPGGAGAEDCLYLVVAAPSPLPAPGSLPVLVYLHGGNLISGAPSAGELEVLATQTPGGLVAVGVNYRLGLLGELALNDLALEDGWVGNMGIQDIILALEWVRDNIAAFGGDATRVTLAGQSSGGTAIFALFAAPRAAGLFTGAYSMSGSPNITMDAAAKHAQDEPVVAALGCAGGATPAARVACLRAASTSALAAAMPRPSWNTPQIFGWPSSGIAPPSAGGWGYAGIVHVDGALLTMSFADALAVELVPAALIISNMEAEGDGGPPQVVRGMTPAQFASFLAGPNSFGGWPDGAAVAASIAAAYAPEVAIDAQLAYDAINSDFGLTCAAQALGAFVAARPQPRAHPLYLMFQAWPRSVASPSGSGRWPYHGLDLRLASMDLPAPNATDLEGGRRIRELLGAFAAGRGELPGRFGWPPVAPGQPVSTYVFARNDTFPYGGVRAVAGFKAAQCGALANAGFDETYWWCD